MKLSILDEATAVSRQQITESIIINPLMKITGDNLDIYIRTSHMSSEKQNRDLHLFTSNLIFSRVATTDMSNSPPGTCASTISVDDCIIQAAEKDCLFNSYAIIIGRLFANKLPAFSWLNDILPQHIPHKYSNEMAQKSTIYALPLQMKNETNLDECVDILESYEEEMMSHFKAAYGK
jgi:hypothetical protein